MEELTEFDKVINAKGLMEAYAARPKSGMSFQSADVLRQMLEAIDNYKPEDIIVVDSLTGVNDVI